MLGSNHTHLDGGNEALFLARRIRPVLTSALALLFVDISHELERRDARQLSPARGTSFFQVQVDYFFFLPALHGEVGDRIGLR